MKHTLFIILLFISTTGLGQTLFFDHLENSIWVSDSLIIHKSDGFDLEKLHVSKDSIRINRTIWYFNDSLRITQYNASLKQETIIGIYAYHIERNQLIISFQETAPTSYQVGVTSTGNFVQLTKSNDISMPLKKAIKESSRIDGVTFDLKFLLRSLPDNGWFLKLNTDSSYEYTHWTGWGNPNGTILETGTYVIKNNRVKLKPDQKKSDLSTTSFFLVTSKSMEPDNHIYMDCIESNSHIYCLYQK